MISQYEPSFNRPDIQAAFDKYIQSDGWFTEHKQTQAFESAITKLLGVLHCFAVNNGTISLSLALLAMGVGPGDEVLVPDLTMIATYNAVKLIGALPVLVDVEPRNLCMDLVQATVHATLKTKAIIYVTLNGRCGDIKKVRRFAIAHKLAFIEDDAQSLCSNYADGTPIGSKADIASFSFSMPKIITTGQGGCLVTNDASIATHLKRLKDFGRAVGGNDQHDYFGINSKFTEMQAILGLSQLKDINRRVRRKRQIYQFYESKLQKYVSFIPTDLDISVPWFVDVYSERKPDLAEYLKAHGIGTRPVYPPLHTQLSVESVNREFPVATKFSERGLWLPCSMSITMKDLMLVCRTVQKFFEDNT